MTRSLEGTIARALVSTGTYAACLGASLYVTKRAFEINSIPLAVASISVDLLSSGLLIRSFIKYNSDIQEIIYGSNK